jgi:hypothetical protein
VFIRIAQQNFKFPAKLMKISKFPGLLFVAYDKKPEHEPGNCATWEVFSATVANPLFSIGVTLISHGTTLGPRVQVDGYGHRKFGLWIGLLCRVVVNFFYGLHMDCECRLRLGLPVQAETALQQSKEHGHDLESELEQTRKVWIAFSISVAGCAVTLRYLIHFCSSWLESTVPVLHVLKLGEQ